MTTIERHAELAHSELQRGNVGGARGHALMLGAELAALRPRDPAQEIFDRLGTKDAWRRSLGDRRVVDSLKTGLQSYATQGQLKEVERELVR